MRVHLLDPPAYTRPYDHALARALAQRDVAVTLFSSRFAYADTPSPDGYRLEESFYRGVRGAPGSRRRSLSGLAVHLPGMLAYRRRGRRDPPDLIHVQWLTLPALDLALLPSRPVVLTVHDPGVATGHGRFSIPAPMLRALSAIIVHTVSARRLLLERIAGIEPGRVHVIAHGPLGAAVLPQTEPPAGLPPELAASAASGRPVVLFFGLLRAYKGLETLLRAWPLVADAELWIVGRPLEGSSAPATDASAGIHVVPRFVNDAEQAAIFAAADLIVLPYLDAGRHSASGVLATALGSGCAVIATRIPEFREVIAAGAAHPVPPGDPVALAAGLRELLTDPERRTGLARAAVTLAGEGLAWDEVAARTEAVYGEILSR